MLAGRVADRLLAAPARRPEEAGLGPALDALGGQVARLRSRDGLRLAGRWLPAVAGPADETPFEHGAIILLHGWSGSVAPDLVEYGPWLRTVAGVFGLDMRGHGDSERAHTTFGAREVEDVAGALAWLGQRGVRHAALFGTSMGGITAIAAAVLLDEPRPPVDGPRIVGVVADSVAPTLPGTVARRLPGPAPLRGLLARRAFAIASRRTGIDLRATEAIRLVGLLEDRPLLLIHGQADDTVPLPAGLRLAAAAGPGAEHWTVPGAGHSRAHETAPSEYEARVCDFLRRAFRAARA